MTSSGHLLQIVDDYKDRHGAPSDASIARALGVASRQTLSQWRTHGMRDLPSRQLLAALARLTGRDYYEVLTAALRDIGYLGDGESITRPVETP